MSRPYSSPTDIANRVCQHVGATRIAAGALFTEDSKQAGEISACYHQLRTAEMRRNPWRFAIRTAVMRAIDTTTMLLVPKTYSATKQYIVGSLVGFEDLIYYSTDPANLGNQPDTSPGVWSQYFGPMTVNKFDTTTSYFAGELVYSPANDSYVVYLSLTTGNVDAPATIAAYSATVTYNQGQTVTASAATWQSNVDLNIAHTPAANTAWSNATTYNAADLVLGSDNHNYSSVAGANIGHNPVSDAGVHWTDLGPAPWIAVPALQPDQMQGQNWLRLDATVKALHLLYPPNSGPVGQPATRNLYQLPNGYLREAPQDPKAGATSFLGAPSGRQYDDWNFQDNFIVTMESRPIVFRFIADIADVSKYDPMFCEGLSLRIGLEVCEPITQSTDKMQGITAKYQKFMTEARIVNGIETGPTEPPLDDYIACRV